MIGIHFPSSRWWQVESFFPNKGHVGGASPTIHFCAYRKFIFKCTINLKHTEARSTEAHLLRGNIFLVAPLALLLQFWKGQKQGLSDDGECTEYGRDVSSALFPDAGLPVYTWDWTFKWLTWKCVCDFYFTGVFSVLLKKDQKSQRPAWDLIQRKAESLPNSGDL